MPKPSFLHQVAAAIKKERAAKPQIILTGWHKDKIEVDKLEINMTDESHVFLRMTDKEGHEYETGLLKEVV